MVRPIFAAVVLVLGWATASLAAEEPSVTHGAYLVAAAGCESCHTDKKAHGPELAGGRSLPTAFGTFYAPNITPDADTGIGKWTLADFTRAMREGKDKDDDYLYPVFPFTSFTNMSDRDIADIYAYLMSRPAVNRAAPANDVGFPFEMRFLLLGWRMLYFRQGPMTPVEDQGAAWNRGRYLAEAVVHCQECHTPRTIFGGLERAHAFAGNPHGPDGQDAPDITSDPKDGIGDWKEGDVAEMLASGMTPDAEAVGKGMADVVDGTAKLTPADRRAIEIYIRSLPSFPQTPK